MFFFFPRAHHCGIFLLHIVEATQCFDVIKYSNKNVYYHNNTSFAMRVFFIFPSHFLAIEVASCLTTVTVALRGLGFLNMCLYL